MFMAMIIGNNIGTNNSSWSNTSKTNGYKNVREYSNYLMGKYSCLKPGNNVAVSITPGLLRKAMSDEKTGQWLERELSKAPDYIKSSQQAASARGSRLVYAAIEFGEEYSTMYTCTVTDMPGSDEDIDKWLERIEEYKKKQKDADMNELIAAMVGRSLDKRFPDVDNVPGEDYLEVRNLSTMYDPVLEDISFTVRKGEIFGLYGLVGAGRSELLESMFGVRTIASGEIILGGKSLRFNSSRDAMDYNFALVTEERKLNGMFGKGTIEFNTCITNLPAYKSNGILSNTKMYDAAEREIKQMRTKCVSSQELITALSGGNQQKVIIGKWMERRPDVFLLDEPTRGIDVGAKYEIYQLIIKMAKEGKTIIVVSYEMACRRFGIPFFIIIFNLLITTILVSFTGWDFYRGILSDSLIAWIATHNLSNLTRLTWFNGISATIQLIILFIVISYRTKSKKP